MSVASIVNYNPLWSDDLGMDHLPTARTRAIPGLDTVPYVCDKPYDRGPFLTYPEREGKPQILIQRAEVAGSIPFEQYEKHHPTPNGEFEAFCQNWLFFGLINELLGSVCMPSDFISMDPMNHSRTISTEKLLPLVDQWAKSIQDGSCSTTYEHVAKCLQLTFSTLRAAGSDFDMRIKFCIASVGELFEFAANKVFKIEDLVLDNRCPGAWRPLFKASAWIERLGKVGWCPSQVEIMVSLSSTLQSLYFVASMQESGSSQQHGLCDSRQCVAYQTDLQTYTTQHTSRECGCNNLFVDLSSYHSFLIDGGLPLLRIREGVSLDDLTVEIVAAKPDACYIALSHVWADGLGNAKANALPQCQLLYMNNLMKNLKLQLNLTEAHDELLLWCDTLCCPIAPGQAKNQVLAQMRNIYERATYVLVLDSSLRRYESEGMSPEEICIRILVSGWMRRLWTLQEGALPAARGRLWLQFKDHAVEFHAPRKQISKSFNSDLSRKGLAGAIILRLWVFDSYSKPNADVPVSDIGMIDRAFRHRAVSVSSDEPLLIGVMLGLDLAEILNGSNETRIHRMWSLMAVRGIPKDILFRLGPRIQEAGYKWAPSTMLYHEDTNSVLAQRREGEDLGYLSSHGLVVRLRGFHISFPRCLTRMPADPWGIKLDETSFSMRDHRGRWYLVARRWPNAEGDYLTRERFGSEMRSRTDLWVAHLETDFQARPDGEQQTSTALLTHLVQDTNEIKYAHSYMHIHIHIRQKASSDLFEAAYQCAQQLAESAPVQKLANLTKKGADIESAEYKAIFDTLLPEIYSIAARGGNELAMSHARRTSGKDNDHLFAAIVGIIFLGHYAILESRTPDNQKWCID